MKVNRYFLFFLILGIIYSCDKKNTIFKSSTLFVEMSPKESGVDFSNQLTENDSINYTKYGYIYMGGGVAIGDVNNDGLEDLYFTGNMVKNKLYLNKGDLKFVDISDIANVEAENQWITGVSMADVNGDGWLDIYVSVSGKWTSTKNLLYINLGLNKDGIPTFEEKAEAYGIADEGRSMQGTFFDYDNDGDLDLYVINYPETPFTTGVSEFVYKINLALEINSNTLYKNNGDTTFTDVTDQVGLKNFGLTISSAIGDFNQDGWMDIYDSNDFASPDNFYFNNGDGTFTDQIHNTTNHTAFYAMGSDVSDFNNDGLLDFFQMDMAPEDNFRSKANMKSMNIEMFNQIEGSGFQAQYMENALQLNRGIDKDGFTRFSDISRLAGVSLTDWSWAALFADFDNDGFKDLFVTNGTRREINNKDYFNKINERYMGLEPDKVDILSVIKGIPSEKIENYAFKNNRDLTFSNVGDSWGLNHKGFSNGTAYADLDNDGDLDLVVNNIDETSSVFRNTANDEGKTNYLQIKLEGKSSNPSGIGAKITLYQKGNLQFQEVMLSRGFQSSVSPIVHFGLGSKPIIDSLLVVWPGGNVQKLTDIKSNRRISIDYEDSNQDYIASSKNSLKLLFKDVTDKVGLNHKHIQNYFDDYDYQILLPHKMSQFGPSLAVGDINNDGLDDFYIGGSSRQQGAIYQQNVDGTFKSLQLDTSWKGDLKCEDVGAVFFDANQDGYADLYVVSGGNEYEKDSNSYQDRLYINNQNGEFIKTLTALPKINSSGSKVIPADFDGDGDLDLFVGGRQSPRNYPLPVNSFILRNDTSDGNIVFTDITQIVAPDLNKIGMVTDATWTDFNGDGSLDLIIVGEWMPLTFFANVNGLFVDKTKDYNLEKTVGWWNTIISEDFDNDGDMDFIAGNLGLNYKYRASEDESFDIYAADFDKNEKIDIVLGYYNDGEQYPVRGRQCSSEQIPVIERKFKDYNSFARADLADIYSAKSLEDALHYQAYNFASSYIENLGGGKVKITPLPNEAQFSSINSILKVDVNKDGHLDLVVSGNLYASEVETPRNDASYGLFLEGNGKGKFGVVPNYKSGLYLNGDVKNAVLLNSTGGNKSVLFAKNNDKVQLYTMANE